MDDKITCDCGVTVLKKQLSRHKKSKRHLDYINKAPALLRSVEDHAKGKTLDLTKDANEEPEEDIEEVNDDASEAETSDNEEVVEVKEKPQKSNSNKFHLDAIRQKAIAKIKEKKQAKIDKELEIIRKAEQYDVLVKSLKDKEENEKKRKKKRSINHSNMIR